MTQKPDLESSDSLLQLRILFECIANLHDKEALANRFITNERQHQFMLAGSARAVARALRLYGVRLDRYHTDKGEPQ